MKSKLFILLVLTACSKAPPAEAQEVSVPEAAEVAVEVAQDVSPAVDVSSAVSPADAPSPATP